MVYSVLNVHSLKRLLDTWMTPQRPCSSRLVTFLSNICHWLGWSTSLHEGQCCNTSLRQCAGEQTLMGLPIFCEPSLRKPSLHVALSLTFVQIMLYTLCMFVCKFSLHPVLEDVWNKWFCVLGFIFVDLVILTRQIRSVFLFRVRVEMFHKHLKSVSKTKMFLRVWPGLLVLRTEPILTQSSKNVCSEVLVVCCRFFLFTISPQMAPGCQYPNSILSLWHHSQFPVLD